MGLDGWMDGMNGWMGWDGWMDGWDGWTTFREEFDYSGRGAPGVSDPARPPASKQKEHIN